MLRPNASLSSALNMLVQGMFCAHFPVTENYNLEMHKSLVLLLAFLMAALSLSTEVQHQFHWKLLAILCN
jgi:hypothetical protein